MGLLRLVRRHGLRDGWLVWRIAYRFRLDAALPIQPRVHIHHGDHPRFTGYRRR